jgi:CDP-glucose 4,6-dehydratase
LALRPALEKMELSAARWRGRRVLVTGHTGFKGSWLSLWLRELGAQVAGFSLAPPTEPSLFELAKVGSCVTHFEGDVRDPAALRRAFQAADPELVVHLAAQSLVRRSYREPVETYQTNLLGSVNLLEQCRSSPSVRGVLVVTSDKCYENRGPHAPYRESDPLGGDDPYSSSKACAELAAAAYRSAFFSSTAAPILATARAGNVIGGGDFALDRVIPDIVRAVEKGDRVIIRNPRAVRPWQHVLESLRGYLVLGERLCSGERDYAEAWNFGPDIADAKPVAWLVEKALALFGDRQDWVTQTDQQFPEAATLMLDSSKARERLGWRPLLDLSAALEWTVEWHRACRGGADPQAITRQQIGRYASLG